MSSSVSVGVCAYNEEDRIVGALHSLLSQSLPQGFHLAEVLVVASGCTDETVARVDALGKSDPRINLLQESERRGKTSALNLIIDRYIGDILVLFNGDGRLGPGALGHLLQPFADEEEVEIACGLPIPEEGHRGVQQCLVEFLWRVHNRTLETLSTFNLENHCCDEFMALRRGFVSVLPRGLINDGAYLGVVASLQGHTVRVCPEAKVFIETPETLRGVLEQRRRILRGHRQIQGLLLHRVNTLEGMLWSRPRIPAQVLLHELVERPVGILILLLLALPLEAWAHFLAWADGFQMHGYRAAWEMVR